MKKMSCKFFLSVVWRAFCQMLGSLFRLFGYKRDGRFAKCVWGIFSISATIIVAVFAYAVMNDLYEYLARKYQYTKYKEASSTNYISSNINYVQGYDGKKGYLLNCRTGEKVLTDIEWIAKPEGDDSLVCFCDGKKRGYFNKQDGRVVIEPKYDHAWIFSDGVAVVDENGRIKIIDGTGRIIYDDGTEYNPYCDDRVFHGGYLVVWSADNTKCGLIDKTGKKVLEEEYDLIDYRDKGMYWQVRKDNKSAVYDKDMNVILPFVDGYAYLAENFIDVTMIDNTMRKYDYKGHLVNDFYISDVHNLKYDTGEVYYTREVYIDEESGETRYYETEDTRKANARLWAYSSGNHEGLMTAAGHVVTMPLYESVEAIGPDLYLCSVSEGDKIVVDGRGRIVSKKYFSV